MNITQQKLIEDNYGLVIFITKRWHNKVKSNTYFNFDDIKGLAHYGIAKAAETYDTNRNAKFATYAIKCMENEICMELRKKKYNHECFFEDLKNKNKEKDNESMLSSFLVDENESKLEENIINKKTLKHVLKNIKSKLKDNEFKVYDMYYFKELRQVDIAKKLNYSQSHISRLLKKVNKKIRKLATA